MAYIFAVSTWSLIQRKRLFPNIGERHITDARNGSARPQYKSWDRHIGLPTTERGRFGRLGKPQRAIKSSNLDRKHRKQHPSHNATVRKFPATATTNKSPTDGYRHPARWCHTFQPQQSILQLPCCRCSCFCSTLPL